MSKIYIVTEYSASADINDSSITNDYDVLYAFSTKEQAVAYIDSIHADENIYCADTGIQYTEDDLPYRIVSGGESAIFYSTVYREFIDWMETTNEITM